MARSGTYAAQLNGLAHSLVRPKGSFLWQAIISQPHPGQGHDALTTRLPRKGPGTSPSPTFHNTPCSHSTASPTPKRGYGGSIAFRDTHTHNKKC